MRRVISISFLCLAILAFVFFGNIGRALTMSSAQVYNCAAVTEIPLAECKALVALYNSAGGSSWSQHTNWLATNTPSNWYGITVNSGHVVAINLKSNQLVGKIPAEIGNLSLLKSLCISDNQLAGAIPTELIKLTNLIDPDKQARAWEGLHLSFNRLGLTDPSAYPYPGPSYPGVDAYPVPTSELQAFLDAKEPNWYQNQSVPEAVDANGGEIDSRDGQSVISVPPGAVSGRTTFEFVPRLHPAHGSGLASANISFHLNALDGSGNPLSTFRFNAPVRVTFHYEDQDVTVMDEASMILYYWNTTTQAWEDAASTCPQPNPYDRDLDNNQLSVNICHLSEFALLGKPSNSIFLPEIQQ